MGFDVDIAIVAIFLLLNLSVGLYYGRGVTSIADYALGGRNFSTAALVSTIVATAITGSLFTITLSRAYSNGLYGIIPMCGMAISLFLLAQIFVPKMKSFLGSMSIASSMGERYGTSVRIITAVCSIIASIGGIAVQYKVFGNVISYFLNIDVTIAVVVTGLVITVYATFGGIRSVTFTDVMQFTVFGTVIPLIGIILWRTALGMDSFSHQSFFQNSNFNLIHVLDYSSPGFWPMAFLFFYSIIPSFSASFYQRIIMGKNIKQVKKAFSVSSMVLFVTIIAVAWISFLLFSLKSDMSSDQLIPYIIDNYSYAGLKGFIIVGIMAMVMSSADSFINVASVLAINDISKPMGLETDKELLLTRIAAAVIGVIPVFLALSGKDLLQIILFVNAFYMPVVTAPLMITILGFSTTKISVLFGMMAGFLTVVIWKIIGIAFDPIAFAMVINVLVMMLVHYVGMQEGGWVKVEEFEDY